VEEDKDEFYKNLNKFFEMMQHEVAKILRDQMENEDLQEGMNFMNQGFKVELGPDGPRFSPFSEADHEYFSQRTSNQWEKPYTEVLVVDNGSRYQIIAEVPGIETEDVKIHFKNNKKMMIQAEFDDYRYRKGLMLKYQVDTNSLEFVVRNGVLEIFVDIVLE
jgi:HSP20 family molecular chaperone IbpA